MRAADRESGLGEDLVTLLTGPETVVESCASTADFRDRLARAAPDVLVSIGAPVVFKADLLAIPRLGAINVHNGQLPRYRGHFGTFWEVKQGESESATVIHRMAATVDAGPILRQARVPLADVKGFLDLLIVKKRRGGELLADLLKEVDRTGQVPAGTPMAGPAGPHWHFPTVAEAMRFRWPRRPRPAAGA
jgi:methionyl-tRNA formyltransferase